MDLPKSATLADMESMLATIEEARPESPLQLRTASTFDGGILSDIWAAILIGTASRRRQCELIGWGLQEQITSKTVFAMTPAFLTAASVASSISPEVSSRMTGMTKGLERDAQVAAPRRQGAFVDPLHHPDERPDCSSAAASPTVNAESERVPVRPESGRCEGCKCRATRKIV